MPQQIAMEGDDVTPAELQGNGWFSVLKRRLVSREITRSPLARSCETAASRLLAMPRSHNRVIARPGGGLNVQACNPHRILAALTMPAQLAPSVSEEDIICLNSMQHFCREHAQRYSSSVQSSNRDHPHRPETPDHGLPFTGR
ncbi:hypothetical protein MTO96_005148 [Rhipicephalus appendiculatus]